MNHREKLNIANRIAPPGSDKRRAIRKDWQDATELWEDYLFDHCFADPKDIPYALYVETELKSEATVARWEDMGYKLAYMVKYRGSIVGYFVRKARHLRTQTHEKSFGALLKQNSIPYEKEDADWLNSMNTNVGAVYRYGEGDKKRVVYEVAHVFCDDYIMKSAMFDKEAEYRQVVEALNSDPE